MPPTHIHREASHLAVVVLVERLVGVISHDVEEAADGTDSLAELLLPQVEEELPRVYLPPLPHSSRGAHGPARRTSQ